MDNNDSSLSSSEDKTVIPSKHTNTYDRTNAMSKSYELPLSDSEQEGMRETTDSLSGNVPAIFPGKLKRFCVVFDMREPGVKTRAGSGCNLVADLETIARDYHIDKEAILETCIKPDTSDVVLVLAACKGEHFFLVQNEQNQNVCLRATPEISPEEIVNLMNSHFQEPQMPPEKVCLCTNKCCIRQNDIIALRQLPNLAKIKIARIRTHKFVIIFRCGPFHSKHYSLLCRNIDSLDEIKKQFLRLFCATENFPDEIAVSNVWFTSGDDVVTDEFLRTSLQLQFVDESLTAKSRTNIFTPNFFQTNCKEFYVHFQPPDSVKVLVNYKPDTIRLHTATPRDRLLLVSPRITAQDLRSEVSKLVEQEPVGLRILVGKSKLDEKLDLGSALSNPNCSITVELKSKITIHITVEAKYPVSVLTRTLSVQLYSYDTISRLKSEVCQITGVPQYYTDIIFDGKRLQEANTLSENRLHDKDKVAAVVHFNRILLRIRSASRRWHYIVIDDCYETLVRDVKMFVLALDGDEKKCHTSEVVVIYKDNVLSDHETLAASGLRRHTKNERLVLVVVKSNCFSASSSFNGKFAVFRDTGSGGFQYVLAMSDGEELFYAAENQTSPEKVKTLLWMRRNSSMGNVFDGKGIRKYNNCSKDGGHQESGYAVTPDLCLKSNSQQMDKIKTALATDKRELLTLKELCTKAVKMDKPHGSEHWSSSTIDPIAEETKYVAAVCERSSIKHSQSLLFTASEPAVPDECTVVKCKSNPSISANFQQQENTLSPFKKSLHKGKVYDRTTSSMLIEETEKGGLILKENKRRERYIPPEKVTKAFSSGSKDSSLTSSPDSPFRTYLHSDSDSCDTTYKCARKNVIVNLYVPEVKVQDIGVTSLIFCFRRNHYSRQSGKNVFKLSVPDIKKNVILHLAENLGEEGLMVIRRLGVKDSTIAQATEAWPRNMTEKHLFCLKAWCKRAGRKANKESLQKVLKESERMDLVEKVDEWDAQSEHEEDG